LAAALVLIGRIGTAVKVTPESVLTAILVFGADAPPPTAISLPAVDVKATPDHATLVLKPPALAVQFAPPSVLLISLFVASEFPTATQTDVAPVPLTYATD
jgi:hypothetical protein